jgi:hypothetical protein
MRRALLTLIATFALTGCSLLYDIGQQHALDNCDRATSPQDRAACRKANSESYNDYEVRRKRLQEGKSS